MRDCPFWSHPASLIQLFGISKLRKWSELSTLPFQPKVLSVRCAWGFPAMNQPHSLGQRIIVLAYRAPSSRQVEGECRGFDTACSLLAGQMEPFKHVGPRLSTFVSHINSSVYLPRQRYFMRMPTVMTGFRRKLCSVVRVLK